MNNLKRKRIEKGLTRKELSICSGISERTIESYEQGRRNIRSARMVTLVRLLKVLNCEIKEIL